MKAARHPFPTLAVFLLWVAMTVTIPARAQNSVLTTVYTFVNTPSIPDGANPEAALTQAPDGSFYCTTFNGGSGGSGTVVRLAPNGALSIVASFPDPIAGGYHPDSPLIQASDGSFYGATHDYGTIFRLTPAGALTDLASTYGTQAESPTGVIQASNGSFYGTGTYAGDGSVFRVNPAGVLTILHAFDGSDGSKPFGGVVQATDGNFYGITSTGGANGKGTIFRVADDGTFTTLYNFDGDDGNDPESSLIQGSDGNFYGTTAQGGTSDAGTIFRVTLTGVLTTLHHFAGGSDGAAPYAGLIQARDGNFYGTTRLLGGAGGNGTIFRMTPDGTLTTLYTFSGGGDGYQPNGLIQANDGSLWGTTRMGGYNVGQGTVFRFGVVPAGILQFSSASYNVNENAGVATVTVSRANGSTGAVSVSYATADGTAIDGSDYTAESGTLAWANGDTADKTFQVPITDLHLTTGNKVTATLTLSAPNGGAALGLVSQATISITQNEVIVQPTVSLTSPPNGLRITAGANLPLAANVNDPSGLLSQVQFQIDGQPVGSASSTGPYVFNATAPTTPGSHLITALAIDNQNRQNSSSATVTVVAADASNPAPSVAILTNVDSRNLAAGSSLMLSATATAAGGAALQRVDFYADGTLFASLDGAGNVVMSLYPDIDRPVRRDAPGGLAANAVFQAAYRLPTAARIVNLIAVALDKLGQSTVSNVASVHATVTNQSLTVLIAGLANGTHVKVGSLNVVNVSTSASAPSASAVRPGIVQRGVHRDASGAATLTLLEYFLNGTRLAQATQPPFTFSFTPPASGKYVLNAVATDSAGVATVSDPIIVVADAAAPTVNLAVGGTGAAVEGGANGVIVVSRAGGDNSTALTVSYKTKGAARAGTDYKTLSGTIIIPAGAAKAKIKVKPLAGLSGEGTLKLKLQLVTPADGSYVVGTGAVKLKLIGH